MALSVSHKVSASSLSTLKTGGILNDVIDVCVGHEIVEAFENFPNAICIGEGSNLLIADGTIDIPIIRALAGRSANVSRIGFEIKDDRLIIDATTRWDDVVAASISAGLQGIQCMSGIPGSVGGGVVQNIGAYGQEVSDVFLSAQVYDRATRSIKTLEKSEFNFSYRSSKLKQDNARQHVVLSVELQLEHADTSSVRYGDLSSLMKHRHGSADVYSTLAIRDAVLEIRRSKGMLIESSQPSVGSFFKNPEIDVDHFEKIKSKIGVKELLRSEEKVRISAAALISASGYSRGFRQNNVGLSEFHVLAIVTYSSDATTQEVIDLANNISTEVSNRFEVNLKPEPVLLGFDSYPFVF